jgi:hypothetical protein
MTEDELLLHDLFTTALEGGIGYWSRCKAYHWATRDGAPALDAYAVVVEVERDGEPEHRIDLGTIKLGLQRLHDDLVTVGGWDDAKKAPSHDKFPLSRITWANVMDETYDADDADAVVQAGLFGEVVYG